jgi:Rrf2 family protein
MRVTHKVDYGIRVTTALAVNESTAPGTSMTGMALAEQEGLPRGFLDDILRLLRNGGIVHSQRGPDGGWSLARPAASVTVADVIRALEGPLASVRGIRPHELADHGGAEPFVSLWVAVRVSLRSVLEAVTLADLASGTLPRRVRALLDQPGAWDAH